jgi:RNA polymerase sigma factor for flagellar operon FliA
MEMTSGQLSRVMDEVKGVTLLSLDHTVGNEDEAGGSGLAEHIVDHRAPDLLADLEAAEMNDLVVDVINRLSDQERLVIALYYYEEMTLKEIGETLRISESRVSQIHTRAITRIRGKMGKLVQIA